MRILILGAGGIGGYYGARLAETGADVTWLVREKRQQLLQAQGLRVKSPWGDVSMPVRTVTAETVTPDYDLIMLAPKAYDLEDSLSSLTKALSGGALLVPFLNGLTHLDLLDARYGRERVAGGVAQIAATLDAEGAVVQLNKLHMLTVGTRHEAHRALLERFYALCEKAIFDSLYTDDIEQHLWNKWTFLATLAAATTLYRGAVGQIMATTRGAELVERMYGECLAVSAAHGFVIPEDAQAKARGVLLAAGSEFTASMYRDLISGLRTEHEHVLGEMCRKGSEKGVDTPLMAAAWCHMQVEAGQRSLG